MKLQRLSYLGGFGDGQAVVCFHFTYTQHTVMSHFLFALFSVQNYIVETPVFRSLRTTVAIKVSVILHEWKKKKERLVLFSCITGFCLCFSVVYTLLRERVSVTLYNIF